MNVKSKYVQNREEFAPALETKLFMIPGKSLLIDSAMILALGLTGLIAYKLSPLLLPVADVFVAPPLDCDLQQAPCKVDLPAGGRLSFALSPSPIPVVEPLDIVVTIDGLTVNRVRVDFAGIDMNMGFLRPELKAAGAGRFAGRMALPACVTGRMNWQATVLIEQDRQRIAVPFRFAAGH